MTLSTRQIAPYGVIEQATKATQNQLGRMTQTGKAMRLARGLYAVGASLPPEQVVQHHLYDIIATVLPQGVICGRSAISGGRPIDGFIYVAQPKPSRMKQLKLPGCVVIPVIGPGPLPGDMPMPAGLFQSGSARTLVENIDLKGRPAKYRTGTKTVEKRIDEIARIGGAGRLQSILSELDLVAGSFESSAVAAVRERLVALLGTSTPTLVPSSPHLAARLSGHPFDGRCIGILEGLIDFLDTQPRRPRPAFNPILRWENLPFFEAYFSNYIEGTEFEVDEARLIVVDGIFPENRAADGHDVYATYQLATDTADRVWVPKSGDELIEILSTRHSKLMAARPEKNPGVFKSKPNFAGGYEFIHPTLVKGTLCRGFETLNRLIDPFFRSAAMMFLITECHPFDDGNGRLARLTSNAELSAASEVRIVIPNVYRSDYLASLHGLSNQSGRGDSFIHVLDFAQQWTASVDWSNFDTANKTLTASNAYLDPIHAEVSGRRLIIPSS